jgi:hypothetical protein
VKKIISALALILAVGIFARVHGQAGGFPSLPQFASIGVQRAAAPPFNGGASISMVPQQTTGAAYILWNDLTTGNGIICMSDTAGVGCGSASAVAHDLNITSAAGIDFFPATGIQVGAPTGGAEGVGTINVASSYWGNGFKGAPNLTCTTQCNVVPNLGQTGCIDKGTTTSISSSAAPAADPDISFANVPAGSYYLQAVLAFNTTVASGYRWNWAATGTNGQVNGVTGCALATGIITNVFANTQICAASTSGGTDTIAGYVTTSGAGSITLNWAQGTSNATASQLLALRTFACITRMN